MSRYTDLLLAETILHMLISAGTGDGHFLLNYLHYRPDDANFDQWAIGRG
jgi:hypothetical protein